MTDPTAWPERAPPDCLLTRRALRIACILIVVASPALWFVLRPFALSRSVTLGIAPVSDVGERWSFEWQRAGDGSNGVWIDLSRAGHEPASLELRPSGACEDPAKSEFGFHIYELTSTGWSLRRADLKAALAEFLTRPAQARAKGWDFSDGWSPGVETSGIIYRGHAPGFIRIPVPAHAVASGVSIASEKTPVGGAVALSFAGQDSSFSCYAPKWESLVVHPEPARLVGAQRPTIPLPNYPIEAAALLWHDSPGAVLTIDAPRVSSSVFGVRLPDRTLGAPIVTGGEMTGDRLGTSAPAGALTWRGDAIAVPPRANAVGVLITSGACALLAGACLLLARLPWTRVVRPLGLAAVRFQKSVQALPIRTPTHLSPFVVVLAISIIAHAWAAAWAPMLYLPDTVEYIYNAQRLYDTGEFSHFNAWRMPGVSFLLLPFIAAFKRPEMAFGWAQAASGVLIACMTYDILRRLVPRSWAALGMLIVAIDPVAVLWERHVITESPSAFLVTGAVWIISRFASSRRDSNPTSTAWLEVGALALGLIGAVATYVRGNAILVVLLAPVFAAWAVWSHGRLRAMSLALVVACTGILAMAPWVLRNHDRYGKPAMIIGTDMARVIFAWYLGEIDVNQTACFDFDAWKEARASKAKGANEFTFMSQLDRSARLPPVEGVSAWVRRIERCRIAADESRARRPVPAARIAAESLLSHLGIYHAHPYFRNTDFYTQPHRGKLFPGEPTNWGRPPSNHDHAFHAAQYRPIVARTYHDVSWLANSRQAAIMRNWYEMFDWIRPIIGVSLCLGVLVALREWKPVPLLAAGLWGGNALAFSWIVLNGETRYSEPLYALAAILAVFGLARSWQWLTSRCPG